MATWFELQIYKDGSDLRIKARGTGDRETEARSLGGGFDLAAVVRFGEAVQRAVKQGRPLPDDVRETARSLGSAILDGKIAELRTRLTEAAKGPLLVRFNVTDRDLQAIPWEAVCFPDLAFGFWATSPDVFPVRTVMSEEAWQPREIRGALRILAIAPTDASSLPNLQAALAPRIATGEVEWLEPVVGDAARAKYLFDRLRRKPTPNVLHFIGHGTVQNNNPALRVGDEDGEEKWIPVELIAQEIQGNFQSDLRAIILEACEGAAPSAFASAAEIFGRAGADAVVAHLWPVRADIARTCSEQLYRALTQADRGIGDISRALNEARRSLFVTYENTSQAFSPVLYLRGHDGEIFDFKTRKLEPIAIGKDAQAPGTGPSAPTLAMPADYPQLRAFTQLLAKPFSLILGDLGRAEHQAFMQMREKLVKDLSKEPLQISTDMPLSKITQLYSFLRGPEKLAHEFQKALKSGTMSAPSIIPGIAARLGPGAHITLLRNPWLEGALVEKHPNRSLYVIQPGEEGAVTYVRQPDSDWEESPDGLTSFDPDKDIVLLRLFRGYTPENLFARPLLTEDDYLHGLGDLETLLSRDLANAITSTLTHRPALFLGISMHAWQHRMLLHRTFPRGIPRESLAIIDANNAERGIWQTGAGLPGRSEGIEALEMTVEDLDQIMQPG